MRLGNPWVYLGVTTLVGPLPFLIVALGQFPTKRTIFGEPAMIALILLAMIGLAGFVLALFYFGLLALLQRFRGGILDWQVISLYLANPVSIWVLVDWYLRRDKLSYFPQWEIALPIIGFVLSWIVFRIVRVRRKRASEGN